MRRRVSRAGKRLRRGRKARGLSQRELGRRAGISRDAVGRLERGEQQPTLTVLMKLAAALAVDLASLL
jgi:transcriptional regulator with XRE-family HTH domain